ncbi:hypothetical protein CRYUN_Cryun41cG0026100 [Craigia yunnanensis]
MKRNQLTLRTAKARRVDNSSDTISIPEDLFTEATEVSSELDSLSMAATKLSLKLLVDVRGQRVLFAEAGKDFVDFLFNIMSLPVGTVLRFLNKEVMVGSLGKLYESIEKLSDVYMQPFQDKDALLRPKVLISGAKNLPQLLPNIESSKDSKHKGFYRCGGLNYSSCRSYIAEDPKATCPQCRCTMTAPVQLVETEKKSPSNSLSSFSSSSSEAEGGFVKGVVTYMVMDDLMVEPMSTISSIALLNRFNVKDIGALEEKTIKFGMDESYIAEDPKATCPQCRNTMTCPVQLVETQKKASSSEAGGGFVKGVVTYMVMDDLMVEPMSTISSIALLNRFNVKDVGALEEKTITFGMDEQTEIFMFLSSIDMAETKLSLKLLIDKRVNKVLFAEAGKEFVDFMFNLLSLPLGTIIRLLKRANMVGSIGNLYQSLENLDETYLQHNQYKNLLLKPNMPHFVIGIPLMFPDTGQDPAERKFYNCYLRPSSLCDR